jgi:hypothetical protein
VAGSGGARWWRGRSRGHRRGLKGSAARGERGGEDGMAGRRQGAQGRGGSSLRGGEDGDDDSKFVVASGTPVAGVEQEVEGSVRCACAAREGERRGRERKGVWWRRGGAFIPAHGGGGRDGGVLHTVARDMGGGG